MDDDLHSVLACFGSRCFDDGRFIFINQYRIRPVPEIQVPFAAFEHYVVIPAGHLGCSFCVGFADE